MPPKNNPTNRKLIEETHDKVNQVATVLLGVPGTEDTGLVGEVKQVKSSVNTLFSKHRKLSVRVWVLIALLVGSGIVSISEMTNLINIFG